MGSNGAMHTANSILRFHSSSKLFHTDSSSFKYILCRIGEVLYNEIPTNGFGVKIGNGFFFFASLFCKISRGNVLKRVPLERHDYLSC